MKILPCLGSLIIFQALLSLASAQEEMESGDSNLSTEMTEKPVERPTGNQLLNLRGAPKEDRTILPVEFSRLEKSGETILTS